MRGEGVRGRQRERFKARHSIMRTHNSPLPHIGPPLRLCFLRLTSLARRIAIRDRCEVSHRPDDQRKNARLSLRQPLTFSTSAFADATSLDTFDLKRSSSSFDACNSPRCNWTTQYVKIPTAAAKTAASANDASIAFSHPWRSNPHMRLTRFEAVTLFVIAGLLI
jgi:hypothetical protein